MYNIYCEKHLQLTLVHVNLINYFNNKMNEDSTLDFSILDVPDIYRLNKNSCLELVQKYGIQASQDVTLDNLRKILSLIKKIYTRAVEDKNFESSVTKLLLEKSIDPQLRVQHPLLASFELLINKEFQRFFEIVTGCPTPPIQQEEMNVSDAINIMASELKRIQDLLPGALNPKVQLGDREVGIKEAICTLSEAVNKISQPSIPGTSGSVPCKVVTTTEPQQATDSNVTGTQTLLPVPQQFKENVPLIQIQNFHGLPTESARDWLLKFEIAANSNRWSETTKINLLPSYLVGTALDWFLGFHRFNKENSWSTWKNGFLEAFTKYSANEDLKVILENKIQHEGESTISYFWEILSLCKKINENMSEEEIIDNIKQGMLPENSRRINLLENKSLEELQNNIKRVELQLLAEDKNFRKRQKSCLKEGPTCKENEQIKNMLGVVEAKLNQIQLQVKEPKFERKRYVSNVKYCRICRLNNHNTEECWKRDLRRSGRLPVKPQNPPKCYICDQTTHFARVCPQRRQNEGVVPKQPICKNCNQVGHTVCLGQNKEDDKKN